MTLIGNQVENHWGKVGFEDHMVVSVSSMGLGMGVGVGMRAVSYLSP